MFKNTLLAAVVSLSCGTASAAETTGEIFGDFRLSLGHFDSSSPEAGGNGTATAPDTDIDNNNSVFGLRAATTHGGLTAFVTYERYAENDGTTTSAVNDNVSQFFYGVRGGFGEVSYGTRATAYRTAGQKLDPFFNTSVAGVQGGLFTTAGVTSKRINGASYGQSALTNDALGAGTAANQIAYIAPAIFGITANAAVFVDEGSGPNEKHDYAGGLEMNCACGLTVGAQFLDINSNASVPNFGNAGIGGAKAEALRAYASYNTSWWGTGVSLEKLNLRGGALDRDYAFASGWFGLSRNTRIAATVGHTNETPFEGVSATVGVFHDLMPNLTGYIAARSTDRDASSTNTANGNETAAIAAGVSYRFALGGKL